LISQGRGRRRRSGEDGHGFDVVGIVLHGYAHPVFKHPNGEAGFRLMLKNIFRISGIPRLRLKEQAACASDAGQGRALPGSP
jgi:hypothetical protein